MKQAEREYQVFIKPVGAACNLRCSYCYYNCTAPGLRQSGSAIMDIALLAELVKQNIDAADEGPVNFAWHGGEPTLAGIDFYRKAVDLQTIYSKGRSTILNGIQTNGTLINEEWCRFLADANFSVGLSIDGPAGLHNLNRINKKGTGTFEKVTKAWRLLRAFGLNPEILCVVSNENSRFPLEIYRYFRKIGASWITFLPLVTRHGVDSIEVTDYSVSADDWGSFLCAVFDEWVENDIGRIKVQIIEEALRVAFDMGHTLCIFKEECGAVPVIEQNGDFYSCDHYINAENRIGNISEVPLSHMLDSDRQTSFGKAKKSTLPAYCLECEVLASCNGECPKNRFISTPSGEPGLNYLCPGYRRFFNHIRPFVEAVRAANT